MLLTTLAILGYTAAQAMSVTSPAFSSDEPAIPRVYTCEGENRPFRLAISGVPARAQSLAVVIHDPDAPNGFTHFVAYNLPPSTTTLDPASLPQNAREGLNGARRTGYRGPCPPRGEHRYITTVYAVDEVLPDLEQPTRTQLLEQMKDHVLDEAQLVGLYAKGRQ